MTDSPKRPVTDPKLRAARAEAFERLGHLLYYHLERLDPSFEARAWEDLPEDERSVYISAIESVIISANNEISILLSGDCNIGGCS